MSSSDTTLPESRRDHRTTAVSDRWRAAARQRFDGGILDVELAIEHAVELNQLTFLSGLPDDGNTAGIWVDHLPFPELVIGVASLADRVSAGRTSWGSETAKAGVLAIAAKATQRKGAKMSQKSGTQKASAEAVIKDIRRATRKQYGAEEKIRIVLEGLRGEELIASLCRREGIAESLYYNWSKEFLEAGKKRLAGDTARAATSDDVKQLRRETRDLKEVVAEQALELRLLKKSMIADGGGDE